MPAGRIKNIFQAPKKPKYVSEVRWRIELRRRKNPERYALAHSLTPDEIRELRFSADGH